jgi:hypothetical protein
MPVARRLISRCRRNHGARVVPDCPPLHRGAPAAQRCSRDDRRWYRTSEFENEGGRDGCVSTAWPSRSASSKRPDEVWHSRAMALEPARRRRREENVQAALRTLLVTVCLVVVACSSRDVPASWPDRSPASLESPAAPVAVVTRALDAHPPLPGEAPGGWAGLDEPGSPAKPASPGQPSNGAAHHGHHDHGADAAATYTCPMHPDVVSDRPGQCPRCGMALIERDAPK